MSSLTFRVTDLAGGQASIAVPVSTTQAPVGTPLYKKDWEDGLVDSGGWGHQAADSLCGGTLPCFSGGIGRGTISVDTTTSDTGTKSGKFTLPASSGSDSRFSQPSRMAAEMLHPRHPDMGVDDYYSQAFRIPTGFTSPYDAGGALCQMNYPGFPPFGLGASNNYPSGTGPLCVYSYCLSGQYRSASDATDYSGGPRSAGYAARGAFSGIPGPYYMIAPGELVFNQWYEVILHVRWSVDYDGIIEGWIRPRGTSAWTQKFSHGPWDAAFCTFPFDDTHIATTGWERPAIRSNVQTTNDKFGLYQGTVNAIRYVNQDSYARNPDFPTAAAQFG